MAKTIAKQANADTRIASLEAGMSEIQAMLQALTANLAAPKVEAKQAKPSTRKAKAKDAALEAKKAAHVSRKESIAAARERFAALTWEKALQFAVAEIKANRKSGFVNQAVANNAASSMRRFLTSETNQGLMASRKANNVKYGVMEAALTAKAGA